MRSLPSLSNFRQNLKLMRELGDRGAQGRACGNLGNTYYLLGDFEAAIEHHQVFIPSLVSFERFIECPIIIGTSANRQRIW